MSARSYIETFAANEYKKLPAGRYFYLKSLTAALTIVTEGNPGSPVKFENVGANSEFGPVAEGQGWRFLGVQNGASAQVVEIVISDDGLFKVGNAVTVSGVALVSVQPSAAIADTPDAVLAPTDEDTIPANLLRKRVHIGVPSSSQNSVRVSFSGGAARGWEIQPGMSQPFETTAALIVRNDDTFASGADASYYVEEET